MQIFADSRLELAESNHLADDASLAEWALDPVDSRRAAAWEAVAERYTPRGLKFRW